jgi:diaminopimelate epimerase
MDRLHFRKMHGLGNDFVVLDRRRGGLAVGAAGARALADRHTGIGCDQIIVIEPPRSAAAQAFMRILNADGGEAEACGNATRCVAALLADESGQRQVVVETIAGLLAAETLPDGRVSVDMGPVRTGWRDVPLARDMDTLHVDLALGPLTDPACANVGNPHATFFVGDVETIDLAKYGPVLERHPLFPERANIGIASMIGRETIRLRVWERGAGLTLACGSGACAALVAACRRGLCGRTGAVLLDGGSLDIEWRGDDRAIMTGPVASSFEGTFDAGLLDAPG